MRLLNGSNARLLALELGPRQSMTLIGNDGGLIEEPRGVDRVVLGTGERAEVLVDFARQAPGTRVTRRSAAFGMLGMMTPMMGGRGGGQGTAIHVCSPRAQSPR